MTVTFPLLNFWPTKVTRHFHESTHKINLIVLLLCAVLWSGAVSIYSSTVIFLLLLFFPHCTALSCAVFLQSQLPRNVCGLSQIGKLIVSSMFLGIWSQSSIKEENSMSKVKNGPAFLQAELIHRLMQLYWTPEAWKQLSFWSWKCEMPNCGASSKLICFMCSSVIYAGWIVSPRRNASGAYFF